MLIHNKISRTATPPIIFFGVAFIFGAISFALHQQWIIAFIFALIGWFLLGSYSGMEINTDTGLFRQTNLWFGVFKTGKWQSTSKFIGLTLVPMGTVSRIYSRSNRSIALDKHEYRIYFVNRKKRPALTIQKCKTREEAQKRMDELAIWLHLPIFAVKH